MALLGVPDVIQNGRQDGLHLGFYLKFKFIGKTLKLELLFVRVRKYETIIGATYDVISRYHSIRLSPNFTKQSLKDKLIDTEYGKS